MRLPDSLSAAAPGWFIDADVVVVGSGIAGLTTAIRARRAGRKVVVVTKAQVDEGSTRWAQGGIAAALAPEDSPEAHLQDTLVAGAGLCDVAAVRVLVESGPAAVRRLIKWGAEFDLTPEGDIALTREGGHLTDRIAHAGGDATGSEILRALVGEVGERIEVIEHALVLDLLQDADGAAQGVTLHVMGEGQRDGVGAILAPAVVLATGGIGQVFTASTNPSVATGDGIGLGLRAGAVVADMEFVQFHPEELAPRDVVAKAIMRQMRATGSEHVWLDGRSIDWPSRFPTILASCLAHGIDPSVDLIPVAPAQHYHSGGLRTDLWGRTSVPGLYACGEVSCTGVHGANRLASNSLLEGLVFADRIADALARQQLERRDPVPKLRPWTADETQRHRFQQTMTEGAGVLRSAGSLGVTLTDLDTFGAGVPSTGSWEMTNLLFVGRALAQAALVREETRGSHWREDFPDADDRWLLRLQTRVVDGEMLTEEAGL
ncbi:MAG: L-aspartate oxidase [Candidatus Nanopelagicales bacterium]|nr:L-aspartate oxidase [Candidatus Nanopelagicales bacterium]